MSVCENCDRNTLEPPTSYVYIASILKDEGHEVSLIDCNAYNILYSDVERLLVKSDFLIFRSTPSTYFHDLKIAELMKKHYPNVKTLMLNWKLNAFSKQALEKSPDVDIYITNYSYETILPELFDGTSLSQIEGITYREDNDVVVNPAKMINKVGDIPKPLWSLLPDHSVFYTRVKAISPWGVVRGSRGCGFACRFCIDHDIPFDPRSPKLIVDEVEDLVLNHKLKYISFFDNTFTVNRTWVMEICNEILARHLRFKWFINTRSNLVDEELLDVMKSSGLNGVSLGIESGSDEILKSMLKGHSVQDAVETVKLIKSKGLKTYISLMMGFPEETEEQMMKTYKLVLKTKPNGFQINVVIPFPHTPLYDDCLKKGLIDGNITWDEMSCVPTAATGAISLSTMSNNELKDLRRNFYRKLYFHPYFLGSNLVWTFKHPTDFNIAVQYLFTNFSRLLKQVTYSH